jgi:hypothetical protein
LKNKRYFEKDIQEVRKLNVEIQDLENEIKELQSSADDANGSLLKFNLDHAQHFHAIGDSFQTLAATG